MAIIWIAVLVAEERMSDWYKTILSNYFNLTLLDKIIHLCMRTGNKCRKQLLCYIHIWNVASAF